MEFDFHSLLFDVLLRGGDYFGARSSKGWNVFCFELSSLDLISKQAFRRALQGSKNKTGYEYQHPCTYRHVADQVCTQKQKKALTLTHTHTT